jgi:hypothetical protein
LRLQQLYGNRFVQHWVRIQREASAGGRQAVLEDEPGGPPPPNVVEILTPRSTRSWAKGNLYDFQREHDDTMAAQRQLLAYHAQTIGGAYGELFRYKPYKHQPLNDLSGVNYFDAQSLRSWNTVDQGSPVPYASTLTQAATRAQEIADKSTQASRDRGKNKAAKVPLTPDEIAALRVYTSDDYREMNAVFRDFRVDQPTANWGKYSAIAKLAISGLGKLPKARGIISYRGDRDITVGGHEGVLRQGATFRLPNFYSTTKDYKRTFAGPVGYVFYNDRYGRLINQISTTPEDEVLLSPGATYKIVAQYDRQDEHHPWASRTARACRRRPRSSRRRASTRSRAGGSWSSSRSEEAHIVCSAGSAATDIETRPRSHALRGSVPVGVQAILVEVEVVR